MVPLVGHRLYFEEHCVPLMGCDCGAAQKLDYAMILAGFDGDFGEAGAKIVGLFAPAADG